MRTCFAVAAFSAMIATAANANDITAPFTVTRDVVYKTAPVMPPDGSQMLAVLWLDVFEPEGEAADPRPAVIFTHGGSFHIGTPREYFEDDGHQDTPPEEYCRRFAARGYVCFQITYRLTPDEPVPDMEDYDESQLDRSTVALMLDRVAVIREGIGLPPLDPENPEDILMQSNAVLAAAEDLRSALNFVRENAAIYDVDPGRVVLGGFSAGAVTSWNVAHGMGEDVAGVFLLSGAAMVFDLETAVTPGRDLAPILFFTGQTDLDGARTGAAMLVERYEEMTDFDYEFAWVPGSGHFYTAGAPSLSADARKMPVDARIMRFVDRVTGN